MGLEAYLTLKPPAAGTVGKWDFGLGSEYVSRGVLDNFLLYSDTPSAAQIIGFTNEDPTTVTFANVYAGTKEGEWWALGAGEAYIGQRERIPKAKYRYFMVLSSSGVPTTSVKIGCTDGASGSRKIESMVNP